MNQLPTSPVPELTLTSVWFSVAHGSAQAGLNPKRTLSSVAQEWSSVLRATTELDRARIGPCSTPTTSYLTDPCQFAIHHTLPHSHTCSHSHSHSHNLTLTPCSLTLTISLFFSQSRTLTLSHSHTALTQPTTHMTPMHTKN